MSVCQFVRNFSIDAFDRLSEIFSFRLGMAEIGITDIFVFSLVKYVHDNHLGNVKVYTTGTKVESVYGNDIDLFVETSGGHYVWYALQAKKMSFNGAYEDIKQKRWKNQWDKLLQHEKTFGSKSYYLLYNGRPLRAIPNSATRSDCIGVPPLKEPGLAVVESQVIGKIRKAKKRYSKIYFEDVFPEYMDAFRKLFCCQPVENVRFYARDDIETGPPYVRATLGRGIPQNVIRFAPDDGPDNPSLPAGAASVRIVIPFSV